MAVPDDVEECAMLTDYAHEFRYPGVAEPVTQEEYERAVAMAERVVGWAQAVLSP